MKMNSTIANKPISGYLRTSRLLKACLKGMIMTIMILTLMGCEKETVDDDGYPNVEQGKGVFVLNEGNFQWANASVGYYKKDQKTSYHELFFEVNGETPGDLLQSMTLYDDELWMMVNNSAKIEIMDPGTGQRTGTITGMGSPRYMLPLPLLNKAYVSDLYNNRVHIIDLNTRTLTGHIPINGWSEALIEAGSKVIVSGVSSGMLYAIDPQTDQITDSLQVGDSPESMVLDDQGMLWVLCQGFWPDYATARLVKADPSSWEIVSTYMLPEKTLAFSRLSISGNSQQLYFLGGDVYTFDLKAENPQPQSIIDGTGMTFYGLGIDPLNNDIYVSDVVDFTQQGNIMRYSSEGTLIDEFEARNIPSGFLFY